MQILPGFEQRRRAYKRVRDHRQPSSSERQNNLSLLSAIWRTTAESRSRRDARAPDPTQAIRYRLLRHDVVCAYHLAPAPSFVLDESVRFGRRPSVRLDIERAEALLHIGHLEDLDGGLGDLIPQFRPELGRSNHRVPDAREKVGEPDLGA